MTSEAAPDLAWVPQLAALPLVAHGFFAAANMHPSRGNPRQAREARRRARQRLGLAAATSVLLDQVHGPRVVALAQVPRPRPAADGAVTGRPNLALTILSADCLPILAASSDGRLIGAAHAGWRGLRAGVVGALLRALQAAGAAASDLRVALGPAIGPCCFKIAADVADALAAQTPKAARKAAVTLSGGRWRADLARIASAQLRAGGVADNHIGRIDTCTACRPGYFSYRRDRVLRGCQGSIIAIRAC